MWLTFIWSKNLIKFFTHISDLGFLAFNKHVTNTKVASYYSHVKKNKSAMPEVENLLLFHKYNILILAASRSQMLPQRSLHSVILVSLCGKMQCIKLRITTNITLVSPNVWVTLNRTPLILSNITAVLSLIHACMCIFSLLLSK